MRISRPDIDLDPRLFCLNAIQSIVRAHRQTHIRTRQTALTGPLTKVAGENCTFTQTALVSESRHNYRWNSCCRLSYLSDNKLSSCYVYFLCNILCNIIWTLANCFLLFRFFFAFSFVRLFVCCISLYICMRVYIFFFVFCYHKLVNKDLYKTTGTASLLVKSFSV